MNRRTKIFLLRYTIALGTPSLAWVITWILEPFLNYTFSPLFFAAVAFTTWYGGLRPGLVSVVLSAIATSHLSSTGTNHFLSFSLSDLIRCTTFSFVVLVIHWIKVDLEKTQRQVERLNKKFLKENEDRLNSALQAAQMGLWDWDLITGKIIWSSEHASLFGITEEAFDGQYSTFESFVHPDDRDELFQLVEQSIKNQVPYQHEFRVILPSGKIRWLEGRGNTFCDSTGKCTRISGTVMNIDARKQAEILLKKQFEQQKLITEITGYIRQSLELEYILQVAVDKIRDFLNVNRVIIFKFISNCAGAVITESVQDIKFSIISNNIYDPCIDEIYLEPFRKGLFTARPDILASTISACHVDFLKSLNVRANLVLPLFKNGQLWGLLAAHHCVSPRHWLNHEIQSLQQITSQLSIALQQVELFEQIQAELCERKQTENTLQEREQLLRLFAQYAPAGIAMFDRNMNYLVASQRWIDDYHLDSLEAILNKSHYEIFPEIPDQWKQVHQRSLAGYIEKSDEDLWYRADGTEQWLSWEVHPWKNSKHEIGGIVIFSVDITQRKQIEIQLKNLNIELENRVLERTGQLKILNEHLLEILQKENQSRQEVENLYNTAPCGYHSLNVDGLIVRINDTELKWIGYTRDEVINRMHFIDLITPDSQAIFRENFPQFLKNGYVNNLEFQLKHRNGTIKWIAINAVALKNHQGDFVMSLSSIFDIHERKQSELMLQQQILQKQLLWIITQTIRESLELNLILESTVIEVRKVLNVDRVAIYRFNHDWSGNFIVESVDETWIPLVEPNVSRVWEDTYLQETQGGCFQEHRPAIVSDIYNANLQPCHIDLLEQFQAKSYVIVPIFSKEHLWGLLAIYQNQTIRNWDDWEVQLLQRISDQLSIAIQQSNLYHRLQLELQERQQTEAILTEANRRWRSLLDNIQLMVVELDIHGCIQYVNPFFLEVTGYSLEEIIHQNWFSLFINDESQQEMQKTILSEVLNGNTISYNENFILTKPNNKRFIGWNNTILKNTQDQVIGTISIGEDITERIKLDGIKQEFISTVSHELRTPMTAIRGSLGLIVAGVYDRKPEKMKEMIAIAARQSDRLVRLVNDILDLRRLEAGQTQFTFAQCQALNLMHQATELMHSQAERSQIEILIQPTSEIVWADADAIFQVLTNLLSNAIKFSPPNSQIVMKAEALPFTSESKQFIRFSIQDQGRGIPDEYLESVFEKFRQVDASDSREKGGTGLGLSICRTIIEKHQGKIWLKSHLGQGSIFYFTLPTIPFVVDLP